MFDTKDKDSFYWDTAHGQRVQRPEVAKFLDDIEGVCQKHNLWISHEDEHGSFIVEIGPDATRQELLIDWFRHPHIKS